MTGEPGAKGLGKLEGQDREATLAWVGEHLALVRQSALGQRVLYWILGTGVVVALFVGVWPAAKKRQFKQALDAYEAAVGVRRGPVMAGPRTGEHGARITCHGLNGRYEARWQLRTGKGRTRECRSPGYCSRADLSNSRYLHLCPEGLWGASFSRLFGLTEQLEDDI